METLRQVKERDRTEAESDWRDYMTRRSALVSTYGTKEGRRMLRDLFERTYILTTTINPKPDAMTYVREGQRNISLEIISHIPGVAAQVIADWLLDMEQEILQRQELEKGDG